MAGMRGRNLKCATRSLSPAALSPSERTDPPCILGVVSLGKRSAYACLTPLQASWFRYRKNHLLKFAWSECMELGRQVRCVCVCMDGWMSERVFVRYWVWQLRLLHLTVFEHCSEYKLISIHTHTHTLIHIQVQTTFSIERFRKTKSERVHIPQHLQNES